MRTIIAAGVAILALFSSVRAEDATKPAEDEVGWRPIFDDKGHQGFRGLLHNDFLNYGWNIVDHVLICPKDIKHMGMVTGGDIITAEQFWDFEFSFEWNLSVSGKTGVLYFATGTAQKPEGFTYQIIDDTHHPDGLKGGPIRRTGALLGIIPPSEDKKLNPPDQWNQGKIVVQGNHIEHWLNGAKVLDFTLGTPEFVKQMAASGIPFPRGFGRKMKTAIVLIDAGEEISFRNVKVRDLTQPGGKTAAAVK
jgi:Domain of Unknown Function (DUF1080)